MQIIREAMELSESKGLFDELREQMREEQEEEKPYMDYSMNRKQRRAQASIARRSAEKVRS